MYHLMRIGEHGFVSSSVALGLDPKVSSCGTIPQRIRRTIEHNSSTKPENWKEDEEFYSVAAALMTNVKNA